MDNIDSKTNPTSTEVAELIYGLARHISHSDEGADVDKSIDELEAAIFGCLESRDDESLLLASKLAIDNNDEPTFDELQRAVEYEAACAEIDESTPQAPATSHLFAIPIILNIPLSGFSSKLEDGGNLRELEQSIAAAGIVDGNPDVHLINYLYTPLELESLSPCDMYHFAKNAHKEMRKKRSARLHQADLSVSAGETIQQSSVPGAARIDSNVVLRYLVGVFIDRSQIDPFETAYNSPDDSPENVEFNASLEQWQTDVGELVQKCLPKGLGKEKLAVGAVDTMYLALRFGESDYRQNVLLLQMYECLSSKQINPKSTRALIVPYGDKSGVTEVRVTLVSLLSNEIVAGLTYEIATIDDYDEVMSAISTLLSTHGVFSIDIVSEIQKAKKPGKTIKDNFITTHQDVRPSYELPEDDMPRVLH